MRVEHLSGDLLILSYYAKRYSPILETKIVLMQALVALFICGVFLFKKVEHVHSLSGILFIFH